MAAELDIVVRKLAHLGVVQAHFLLLGRHAQAQAGDQVQQEQDDARHNERVREAGHAVSELVAELDPVVVEPAAGDLGEAVEMGNVVAVREGDRLAVCYSHTHTHTFSLSLSSPLILKTLNRWVGFSTYAAKKAVKMLPTIPPTACSAKISRPSSI